MSRDAAIKDLVASYSPQENCDAKFLEKFKIALSECATKVALAKKDCPTLIAENLPNELDEKQAYKLVGRSKACVLVTIWGRPYNGLVVDRAAEKMWEKEHDN